MVVRGGFVSVGRGNEIMVISWLSTLGTFLNLLCLCGDVDSCLGLALAFFWLTSWSLFLVADARGPLLPSCVSSKVMLQALAFAALVSFLGHIGLFF